MYDSYMLLTTEDIQRFHTKYEKGSPDECWEWQWGRIRSKRPGSNIGNYGQFWLHGRTVKAHRISYFIANGEYDDSAFICHTCDNPPCVNPNHLYIGDKWTNSRDKLSRGRSIGAHKGEAHHNAKLTRGQIAAIRTDPRAYKYIADEYGISRSYVSLLKNGKVRATDADLKVTPAKSGEARTRDIMKRLRVVIGSDPRKTSVIAADYQIPEQSITRAKKWYREIYLPSVGGRPQC